MTNELFRELHGTIAIDTETHDPFLKTWGAGWARPHDGGRILGVVVTDAERSDYFPVSHDPGGNLDPDQVFGWLKDQLKKPDLNIVFANGGYDIGWLATEGVEVKGRIEDVLAAAAMLNENERYDLDKVALETLGIGKDESEFEDLAKALGVPLKDIKKHFAKTHPNQIRSYAEQDGRVTFDAWQVLKKKLDNPPELKELSPKDQERYHSKKAPTLMDCYNMEMQLIPALVEMRQNGVRVDERQVDLVAKELRAKEVDLKKRIKDATGVDLVPSDKKTIIAALDGYGIKFPRTPKGNISVTNGFLDSLEESLEGKPGAEVPQMVVRLRKIEKTRRDYVESVPRFMVKGRIHCSLNALPSDDGGTVSGRFSCVKPNLQQQPSPDKDPELGYAVRRLYLPEEGCKWGAMDYSQQEPRLTVHYAGLLKMAGTVEAVRAYNEDPNTDYHSLAAQLTGLPRKQAKTINLGIAYGMGGLKLCKQMGLPTKWVKSRRTDQMIEVAGEEGQAILDQYALKMPFVSELSRHCEVRASRNGFIRTLMGRHCRFPVHKNEFGHEERWYTYRAMNRLIQGSAADQTKYAMIQLHKEGIHMLITVHDEVGISAWSDREITRAKEIMETCLKLTVPSKVDAEVGESWGTAK